jgi:hypothetical protein
MSLTKELKEEREEFHLYGATVIKNIVSKDLCEFLYSYLCMQKELKQLQNSFFDLGDDQVPDAQVCVTKDACLESIYSPVLPIMEKVTGQGLFPTYCYARIYQKGNILHKHTDRESCEVSLSLKLFESNDQEYNWPIWAGGKCFHLEQGDALLYKGCDIPHWREKCEGGEQYALGQLFVHSVRKKGRYANFAYDKDDVRKRILAKTVKGY